MDQDLLRGIGNNGPWAAAAAFLCYQILKSWREDRQQVNSLLAVLPEFKNEIAILSQSVARLADRIEPPQRRADDSPVSQSQGFPPARPPT